MTMEGESFGLIVGISLGLVIGVVLAVSALFCFRYHRKKSQIVNSGAGGGSSRSASVPIRENGADSCIIMSDSTIGPDSPVKSSSKNAGRSLWLDGFTKKSNVISASGILEYSYRDLQKATCNFTTLIGQGAFGPVYKAQMSTGETVAVKVLATDSKQGEKEFQTEVMLLGRLHHRNLVNLVGYCAEKGQHMLIYVYMSKGSLASHLYSGKHEPLSWDLRVYIALDVARGLEYLHDGAVPPVIHRDIKSSNILLDQSMRARVADFGLSREEMVDKHAANNIRGTFGYLDPEYISTRTFTKKSDVYGFGVLLFELIAGRNPQQGLMELVELAAMNAEEKVGWEEIVDSRLDGRFDLQEVNEVAAFAYKCISRAPRKRPNMRDIVQVLTRVIKVRNCRKRQKSSPPPPPPPVVEESEGELTAHGSLRSEKHRRDNSVDSSIAEDL
ncbi:PREDICTED: calcium/calmodulin-regulated receptor-like kinase 1 [Camelina sativa]|uniref:Calcium/calmodulin-regulated receptor-like kinase 1 n=1 Tax=Camelina sativa TaxID=90675 RepID=A0ABM0X9Z7_CAMSA|nr:PREDICTED: calcium/calmodulin-regulated receptor-like kinase 1 [Camelina sativa]